MSALDVLLRLAGQQTAVADDVAHRRDHVSRLRRLHHRRRDRRREHRLDGGGQNVVETSQPVEGLCG